MNNRMLLNLSFSVMPRGLNMICVSKMGCMFLHGQLCLFSLDSNFELTFDVHRQLQHSYLDCLLVVTHADAGVAVPAHMHGGVGAVLDGFLRGGG